jgi:hypothetical protein
MQQESEPEWSRCVAAEFRECPEPGGGEGRPAAPRDTARVPDPALPRSRETFGTVSRNVRGQHRATHGPHVIRDPNFHHRDAGRKETQPPPARGPRSETCSLTTPLRWRTVSARKCLRRRGRPWFNRATLMAVRSTSLLRDEWHATDPDPDDGPRLPDASCSGARPHLHNPRGPLLSLSALQRRSVPRRATTCTRQ